MPFVGLYPVALFPKRAADRRIGRTAESGGHNRPERVIGPTTETGACDWSGHAGGQRAGGNAGDALTRRGGLSGEPQHPQVRYQCVTPPERTCPSGVTNVSLSRLVTNMSLCTQTASTRDPMRPDDVTNVSPHALTALRMCHRAP
eukprot:2509-Prorocentrum_minimum.AAC.1